METFLSPGGITFLIILIILIVMLAILVRQLILQIQNKEPLWGDSLNQLWDFFRTPHTIKENLVIAFIFLIALCFILIVILMIKGPIVTVDYAHLPTVTPAP